MEGRKLTRLFCKAVRIVLLALVAVVVLLVLATGFLPSKSQVFQYEPVHFALGRALHSLGPVLPILNGDCGLISYIAASRVKYPETLTDLYNCIRPRDAERGGCPRPRWNTCAELVFSNFVRSHPAFRAALKDMLRDPCESYTAEAALAFSRLRSSYKAMAEKPSELAYAIGTCRRNSAKFESVLHFEDRGGNVVETMNRGLGRF